MKKDDQQYLPLGDLVLPRVDADQEMIDEVINHFDFLRVQTAMQALGWSYFEESEAPSIETLQTKARYLLEAVTEKKEKGVELQSGGFRASWYPGGSILLTFVVVSGHARRRDGVRLPEVTAAR